MIRDIMGSGIRVIQNAAEGGRSLNEQHTLGGASGAMGKEKESNSKRPARHSPRNEIE
jgi:hypothetical protein